MKTKIDIRRAITERGYTITSFCQKFNLKTQNIIQNYIKGNPTIKRLEDICEKLDCDITELFYPIQEPTADETEATTHTGDKDSTEKTTDTEAQRLIGSNGQSTDEQPVVNTTAFCPHCGAKVRVGVVLLTE